MSDVARSAVLARLAALDVPAEYQAAVAGRPAPRFYVAVQLTLVLGAIAAAVAAPVAWSRYLDGAALAAAQANHALLYDSDIGAESVGVLLTTLCLCGWLGGLAAGRLGRESSRNAVADDLRREPGKYKGAITWVQKLMIRRHTAGASSADEFLDRLAAGTPKDFGWAALAMLALTLAASWLAPARLSFATDAEATDRPMAFFVSTSRRAVGSAITATLGCPKFEKTGPELVFRLRFTDGTEDNLGSWRPLRGDRIAALETIAASLPAVVARVRFCNLMFSNPLSPECIEHFGGDAGPNGVERLLKLLSATDAERAALKREL